eukprot:GHVL01016695.1.p1 GENE.GHVL01016695.1~~GHVL01016695.1.p1  ORF type:complete len:1038 (+),score=284.94 GHVL01016695.1:205-3114(+)
MPCKKYPYKGYLDLAANRCLAQGTDAWTCDDHICFTVKTANLTGILNILNIYLEHILNPSFTEDTFLTEIYHIDSDGLQRGVVFCELEESENNSETICYKEIKKNLYGENSRYYYESGGIMNELSKLKLLDIINYHKKYIKLNNLSIIIIGANIDDNRILEEIIKIENNMIDTLDTEIIEVPKAISNDRIEDITKYVSFPSDDVQSGLVIIGYIGPEWLDIESRTAITIILEYLTADSIGPLQKLLVDSKEAWCADVQFSTTSFNPTYFYLELSDVSTENLNYVSDIAKKGIKVLYEDGVNIIRMNNLIKKLCNEWDYEYENEPIDFISENIIEYCIYGNIYGKNENIYGKNEKIFYEREVLEKLMDVPIDYWHTILEKWFINNKSVTVVANPSPEEVEKIAEQEKNRRSALIEALGAEGLKQNEIRIKEAEEIQLKSSPGPHILADVPLAPVSDVVYLPYDVYRNFEDESSIADLVKFPCQLVDVEMSDFFDIQIMLDTSKLNLTLNEKILLPFIVDSMFGVDLNAVDFETKTHVSYLDVGVLCEKDTLDADCFCGHRGETFRPGFCSDVLSIRVICHTEKYLEACSLIKSCAFFQNFTYSRIKSMISSLLCTIDGLKQTGHAILHQLSNFLTYKSNSVINTCSIPLQEKELKKLKKKKMSSKVRFQKLYNNLFPRGGNETNLLLNITGSLKKLPSDWSNSWNNFLRNQVNRISDKKIKYCPPPKDAAYIREDCDYTNSIIIGLGSEEAENLIFIVKNDGVSPCLLVMREYFNMIEGSLYRTLRGSGLAYDFHMSVQSGLVTLEIGPSNQIAEALHRTLTLFTNLVNNDCKIDENDFYSSKNSLISSLISNEATISQAGQIEISELLKNSEKKYNKKLIDKVAAVSQTEVETAMNHILLKFLNFKTKNEGDFGGSLAIIANIKEVTRIVSDFADRDLPDISKIKRKKLFELIVNSAVESDEDSWTDDD